MGLFSTSTLTKSCQLNGILTGLVQLGDAIQGRLKMKKLGWNQIAEVLCIVKRLNSCYYGILHYIPEQSFRQNMLITMAAVLNQTEACFRAVLIYTRIFSPVHPLQIPTLHASPSGPRANLQPFSDHGHPLRC